MKSKSFSCFSPVFLAKIVPKLLATAAKARVSPDVLTLTALRLYQKDEIALKNSTKDPVDFKSEEADECLSIPHKNTF
jgi:hypothetical protein